MDPAAPILSLRNIGKAFSGNRVLTDVSFDVAPGEIIGLVGENGAGKSTLMKLLFGMPVIYETGGYEGSILFEGREVRFRNPFEALDAGHRHGPPGVLADPRVHDDGEHPPQPGILQPAPSSSTSSDPASAPSTA